MKALFYTDLKNQAVRCDLCPHYCKIEQGAGGLCGVRANKNGELLSLVHNNAIALQVDPIEKKPLFHVLPGSLSFSVATAGCNFKCDFCQNHSISQWSFSADRAVAGEAVTAKTVVELAMRHKCQTIACTYTEPTVFFEYALDIARLAQDQGIKTVWVSNGFINEKPLAMIAPYISAANIDLKGWDEGFYKNQVGGKLSAVLKTLRLYKKLNIWLEVTTLLVPGFVDNEKTLRDIAVFIKDELGAETPWHISRFYPQYRMRGTEATNLEIIRRACEIGAETGLRYVYSGNVPGDAWENTVCYDCGELLIQRNGYHIKRNILLSGACPSCHSRIDGLYD